jgi:hypothetical protein
MSTQQGWIGFDLDGTLAHYEGWKGIDHIGEPIAPMVGLLKSLLAEGQTVKIFTARIYRRLQKDAESKVEAVLVEAAIWDWLGKQGIPELEITCVKDFGMIKLYDDRCVQVETNTGRIIQ